MQRPYAQHSAKHSYLVSHRTLLTQNTHTKQSSESEVWHTLFSLLPASHLDVPEWHMRSDVGTPCLTLVQVSGHHPGLEHYTLNTHKAKLGTEAQDMSLSVM